MSDMLPIITIATGFVATTVPLYFAYNFMRDVHGFGVILALMLIGEAMAMGVTTLFAFGSYFGEYGTLTEWQLFGRRMAIFIPCLASTVALGVFYCRKLHQARAKARGYGYESV